MNPQAAAAGAMIVALASIVTVALQQDLRRAQRRRAVRALVMIQADFFRLQEAIGNQLVPAFKAAAEAVARVTPKVKAFRALYEAHQHPP